MKTGHISAFFLNYFAMINTYTISPSDTSITMLWDFSVGGGGGGGSLQESILVRASSLVKLELQGY